MPRVHHQHVRVRVAVVVGTKTFSVVCAVQRSLWSGKKPAATDSNCLVGLAHLFHLWEKNQSGAGALSLRAHSHLGGREKMGEGAAKIHNTANPGAGQVPLRWHSHLFA